MMNPTCSLYKDISMDLSDKYSGDDTIGFFDGLYFMHVNLSKMDECLEELEFSGYMGCDEFDHKMMAIYVTEGWKVISRYLKLVVEKNLAPPIMNYPEHLHDKYGI
jgi:hypothetical protein